MLKLPSIIKYLSGIALVSACLCGCSTTPPQNPENLCSVFQEKDSWYMAAHKVHNRYGVPINVAMAIMAQESGYVEDAQPPMRWFLFVPYGRGSSSYGYAQAQDEVWEEYVAEQGSFFSDRDDFADALDFIGWYMQKTRQKNNIPYSDAYNQYLNYHEGWGGFSRGTYAKKTWLKNVAKKVKTRAERYRQQLLHCNLY